MLKNINVDVLCDLRIINNLIQIIYISPRIATYLMCCSFYNTHQQLHMCKALISYTHQSLPNMKFQMKLLYSVEINIKLY